nr:hypothetical protein [Anaerolineae bacterium]
LTGIVLMVNYLWSGFSSHDALSILTFQKSQSVQYMVTVWTKYHQKHNWIVLVLGVHLWMQNVMAEATDLKPKLI